IARTGQDDHPQWGIQEGPGADGGFGARVPAGACLSQSGGLLEQRRRPGQGDSYTREALKLDPDDPYNLVFAAVFTAAAGHTGEALKLAQKYESLVPASYNLAAIYAQAGQKQK